MRLRVATYNIHSGIGNDRAYDPRRIADVLAEIDADVIGLQEVSARPELDGVTDQFHFFEAATGMTAVPGPNIVLREARYGNVLLSRRPLLAERRLDLSVGPYEPRGAVVADVAVPGATPGAGKPCLRVVVTHLGLRVWERARQHGRLGEIVAARRGVPVVLMGDFNSWWPDFAALKHLGPRIALRSSPASYPAHLPFLALDRIWAVPDIIHGRVRVHRSPLSRQASDHLPVVADLDLRRAITAASLPPAAPGVDGEDRRTRRTLPV